MNDETYLAHRFCTAFASHGHQCAGELKLKAERLLVSYRPLAHDYLGVGSISGSLSREPWNALELQ